MRQRAGVEYEDVHKARRALALLRHERPNGAADVHLHLKRAQLDQVAFGDARHHRTRLAAILQDRLSAGASIWPDP